MIIFNSSPITLFLFLPLVEALLPSHKSSSILMTEFNYWSLHEHEFRPVYQSTANLAVPITLTNMAIDPLITLELSIDSLVRGGGLMSPFHMYDEMMMAPILYRSCEGSHSWSEFMRTMALSCPEDTFSQNSSPNFNFYILSGSLLTCSPNRPFVCHPSSGVQCFRISLSFVWMFVDYIFNKTKLHHFLHPQCFLLHFQCLCG